MFTAVGDHATVCSKTDGGRRSICGGEPNSRRLSRGTCACATESVPRSCPRRGGHRPAVCGTDRQTADSQRASCGEMTAVWGPMAAADDQPTEGAPANKSGGDATGPGKRWSHCAATRRNASALGPWKGTPPLSDSATLRRGGGGVVVHPRNDAAAGSSAPKWYIAQGSPIPPPPLVIQSTSHPGAPLTQPKHVRAHRGSE